MSKEKTKEERQEDVELVGKIVLIAVVAAAIGAVTPVAVVAVLTVMVLRWKPDRRNARLVMMVGAVPALAGVMLAAGYWQAVQAVLDGRADAATWVALGAYGVAVGPFVGGVAARFLQRRREREPLRGPGVRMQRVAVEDRRKRHQAHTRQKKAAGMSGDGRVAQARKWVAAKRAVPEKAGKSGPRVGRYLRGELDDWNRRGVCEVPMVPRGHAYVGGDAQTGKSEFVAALEEYAMEHEGGQVISISGKEPPPGEETSRRLLSHAYELGQSCNVLIPGVRPYDIMRAGPREIRSRLMDTQEYSEPHHEAGTNVVLDFALEKMDQEGRDIADLPAVLDELSDRERVTSWAKRDAFAERVIESVDPASWKGAVQRYMSVAVDLAGFTGGQAAGGVAFEDAHVTVIDLPTSTMPTSARMLMRLLLSDLEAYISSDRRPRLADGSVMPLTVKLDELSALDGDPVIGRRVINMMERALSARVRFIPVTQDPGGLGDDRTRDAVLGKRCFFFRSPQWAEHIARTFGTRQAPEASETYEGSFRGGSGTVRMQDQWAVSPNELRSLNKGECIAKDERGGYAKLAVTLKEKGFQIPDTPVVRELDQELAQGRRWLSEGGGIVGRRGTSVAGSGAVGAISDQEL